MKYKARLVGAALFVVAATHTYRASACPAAVRKKILKLNKKAMEDYDLLEFETAKQTLLDAQTMARRKGCDDHSVAAKTYVNLAVLYIQGFKDEDRGRLMFRKALRISKRVQLDRQVATPRLLRIFNSVKRNAGVRVVEAPRPRPRETRPEPEPEDEKPAKGLEHTPLEEAPRNTALVVKCRVGNDLTASKVILFYKVVGQNDFQPSPMKKASDWTWKTFIPAGDVRGRSLYYYIEVRHGGKPQAASGNAASPHIIMLTAPKAGDSGPAENPLDRPGSRGGGGPTVKGKGKAKSGHSKFFMALSGGLGVGYVGKWKGDLSDIEPRTPGFAMGTIGGLLEAGYFLNPSMLISLAFNLGYASSDRSERPVLGWQVLARFRYVALGAPPKSLFKFYVGGQLGGGDVYHVLELDGRTDTFRSGPGLLIGALVGFWVGTETVSGFLEVAPTGVIDFTKDVAMVDSQGATVEVQHNQQHTFVLGISAGVAFRF